MREDGDIEQMNDMTQGKPMKQILVFMLPVLLGNLFQQLYNVMDIIIVGQFLGVDALASVGMTGSIVFLVVGWVTGLTTGFGLLIAQAFGAKDDVSVRHYTAMSAYICGGFAVVMTTGLLLGNDIILRLLNTPDNIYSDTRSYITAIYAALTVTILYNMLAAASRALGDSKTPLYFLMFSSVLNIGLDLLFVGVLPFGVAGAGYATFLAQAVSAILCFLYVYKKYPVLHFSREEARWNWLTFRKLMSMGLPMGLQFSITAIGTMIVQSSLNLLGSTYIAAYTAAMKLQNIILQVSVALGAALSNFVGQNYGAGNLKRVKQGVRAGFIITSSYNAVAMVVGYFIAPYLVVIFADDPTGELVAIAGQLFHISARFYIPLGLIFVYRNALQGMGNGFVPMMGGVFELIARALVVFTLFKQLQFLAIIYSDPIAWLSALIPLVPYYYWYMKKIDRQNKIGSTT